MYCCSLFSITSASSCGLMKLTSSILNNVAYEKTKEKKKSKSEKKKKKEEGKKKKDGQKKKQNNPKTASNNIIILYDQSQT